MNPILLLEMNEIPWRVLKHYQGNPQFPNINEFFQSARAFTSVAVDDGELSPWITWPTLHRGIPKSEHKVLHLGQDPATFRGTPLWDEFRKKGATIGVFGSLQSWPAKDPGAGGFYVPDTFAHDENCIPSFLNPIQRFNLNQVSQSNRVVTSNPLRSALSLQFFLALRKAGVRPTTLVRLAWQLLAEKLSPERKARRSIYQGVLFWDIFRNLYDPKNPPAFATFFSNHVAAIMHRYWHHIFPSDFPEQLRPPVPVHQKTMDFALRVLDDILGEVLGWMKDNPELTVVFATSMGQGSVIRGKHHGFELTVSDVKKLMAAAGLRESDYTPLLAMAPQSAVEIRDEAVRRKTIAWLDGIEGSRGTKFFHVQAIGPSLSITLETPAKEECLAGKVKSPSGPLSFSDFGVRLWEVDAGTAYHIPEGILAVAGKQAIPFANACPKDEIRADAVKGLILNIAGI